MNEKISWKHLLIGLGIYSATQNIISNYKNYSYLTKMYNTLNSPLKKGDKEIIEETRSKLIENVRNSNLFKRFNRESIIDSLKSITIRIVDTLQIGGTIGLPNGEYSGVCINIDKSNFTNKLMKPPDGENFILIERYTLNDKYNHFDDVLCHELYHYIDRLYNGKNEYYSKSINLEQFFDKKINDIKYAKSKIRYLLFLIGKDEKYNAKDLVDTDVDVEYNRLIDMKEYFQGHSEIFTRFNTTKERMIKFGIIKSMNDRINDTIVSKYMVKMLQKKDIQGFYEATELFFYLDLGKIEDLDKILTN